ncbi:DUF4363 family protein [Salsuginibacillus kocurii]|uniref:DUF4363 family protein n=1 Tax=Salsuginibacillus kocurii TaxID=427078 RepID=UPI00037833A3|nr:DUF4363 family protein [Salsuginibacillus kocurii]
MATGRSLIILLFMLSFLTGCELFMTEKDDLLFATLGEIREHIEEEEWEEAYAHIEEFQKRYEEQKWKLQLLGGVEDYNEIELQILQFKETIKEEDALESKIGLSQMKHRLTIIYHL